MKMMMSIRVKLMWIVCGMLLGMTIVSTAFGSIPKNVKDDPAFHQQLSELKIKKEIRRADSGMSKLIRAERKFIRQERAHLVSLEDHPRLKNIIARVEERSRKYRAKGKRKATALRKKGKKRRVRR